MLFLQYKLFEDYCEEEFGYHMNSAALSVFVVGVLTAGMSFPTHFGMKPSQDVFSTPR